MFTNKKKNVKGKVLSVMLMLTLLLSTTAGVFATTYTSNFEGTWYTGNAGSVDGSANGVYHKLGKGTASISYKVNGATSTYPVNVTLKRSVFGFDKNYGNLELTTTSGTKSFKTKTDEVSSKYYIIAGGGTKDTEHTIKGTLTTK